MYKGSVWVPVPMLREGLRLFDSIFDIYIVKTVTTQHIVYACITQNNAKKLIYTNSGLLTSSFSVVSSVSPFFA